MPTCRRRVQINPNKTKQGQIKPSKIAWFNLVLFVRIGTFQWVIVNPNKNSSPWFFPGRPHLTYTHGSGPEFLPSETLAQIPLSGNHLLAHERAVTFAKQLPPLSREIELCTQRPGDRTFRAGRGGLEKAVQRVRTQVIETGCRQKAGRRPFDRGTRSAA
jgi:hypothetical protein